MSRRDPVWQVEVHDSVEPLEAEWHALAVPENSTPFQNYGLMRLFYRHLAANRTVEPVVALVRNAEGRPVALFPMMRSRRHGLNWLRTDARPIDYCAPIFDASLKPEQLKDVIKAMLAAVPRADLLYCNKMPADFLGTANPIVELPNAARLRFSAWVLKLAGRSGEEVLAVQQPKFRANLRRRKQKLAREYTRVFEIAFGDEITDADFTDFLRLRSQSFEEKQRSDILDDPLWAAFYGMLAEGGAGACRPWLSRLKADGEIIAMLFGFSDGQRPVAIMPASKLGEWKQYSPGLQLFEETILYFRNANATFFDLSVGDMPYKRRLGCEQVAFYDAMFPGTVAGWIYYAVWRLKVKIRVKLKPITQ